MPQDNKISSEIEKYGYTCVQSVEIKEIAAVMHILSHGKTGARHMHIQRDDKENSFGVIFKTVPDDSTGVAHILEHTVLCGSEKYSVRDPFFSMLKRSLNTFMNAFTAPDWTMYPFSTQNRKDYFNLMDVYLDAAFFPEISELSFMQEGHRLEVKADEEGLTYEGVVYNEMKGAMSSVDQIMGQSLSNALFPDTTYGINSGGDPAEIPGLTHEDLKAFHATHYHPSNAFFYTYGDISLVDSLKFISEKVLSRFTAIDPGTDVPGQPRFTKPKKLKYYYPLTPEEDNGKKSQASVAWLISDVRDSRKTLSFKLLEHMLLGNSGSPLRKALIDSGLGAALSDGTGYDPDYLDTFFSCGLKEINESDANEVEKIVLTVLEELSINGIPDDLKKSAIHKIEFNRREITNSPYPYGLKLLLYCTGTWIHGGDPGSVLKFDNDIEYIKEESEKTNFFENIIKEFFLENSHRALVVLSPDHEMRSKQNERTEQELKKIEDSLSKEEKQKIIDTSKELALLQESEEDISCLPTLGVEDIPKGIKIEKMSKRDENLNASVYNRETSNILYFTAVADAGVIEKELVPLVPFFCRAFTKAGTQKRDYAQMAGLIDMYTGGVSLSASVRSDYSGKSDCLPFGVFSMKCLDVNREKAFEIADELLTAFDFSDTDRLKNLLLEYRAGLESSIVRNGHRYAMSLASRNFGTGSALSELWGGVGHLQVIKEFSDSLSDKNLSALSENISRIAEALFSSSTLKAGLVGNEEATSLALTDFEKLRKRLSLSDTGSDSKLEVMPSNIVPCEGWITNSAVSFVARAFDTVKLSHADAPALAVLSRLVKSLFLHREIREKGGAYGGLAAYNSSDGHFFLASYRDPHIVRTLDVYDKALDFMVSGAFSDEDIKEAVLSICSDIDRPDPPGPSARRAFFRDLVGLSDELRENYKEGVLSINKVRVKEVAQKYFGIKEENPAIVVISGEEQLKAANEVLKDKKLNLFRI